MSLRIGILVNLKQNGSIPLKQIIFKSGLNKQPILALKESKEA